VTKKIPKAVREGRDLLDHFYGFSQKDASGRWLQKEAFRQDAYRMIILQLQLSIEELLRSFVFEKVTTDPDPGIFGYKQHVEFVVGLSTRQLLDLAARLHVLSKDGYDALVTLNTVRNKIAHHWMLHATTVAEMIQAEDEGQAPVPRINFKGKNLLTPAVMKDEFIPIYTGIYLELFAVHYGADFDRRYTDPTLTAVREL
jgi:hypothetical protein